MYCAPIISIFLFNIFVFATNGFASESIFALGKGSSKHVVEKALGVSLQSGDSSQSFRSSKEAISGSVKLEKELLRELIVFFQKTESYSHFPSLAEKTFSPVQMNEHSDVVEGAVFVGDAEQGKIWKISANGILQAYFVVSPWSDKGSRKSIAKYLQEAKVPRPPIKAKKR